MCYDTVKIYLLQESEYKDFCRGKGAKGIFMHYHEVISGCFIHRPNRFIAQVEINGAAQTVHVKNTGRCRELLVPGATVYLEKGTNPNRKTAYDLIAVEKNGLLINMDSQAPNQVFAEWAESGGFSPDVCRIRREYTYGASRLDFCLETSGGLHLVEVKGVTLEENGETRFPDAPTERGIKHLRGLADCLSEGYEAAVCFVIQMADIQAFSPNDTTHPAFGEALREVQKAGVQILAMEYEVEPGRVAITNPVALAL
jgi:sugar fermentation stimulation protein A